MDAKLYNICWLRHTLAYLFSIINPGIDELASVASQ